MNKTIVLNSISDSIKNRSNILDELQLTARNKFFNNMIINQKNATIKAMKDKEAQLLMMSKIKQESNIVSNILKINQESKVSNIAPIQQVSNIVSINQDSIITSIKQETNIAPIKQDSIITSIKQEANIVPIKQDSIITSIKQEANIVPIKQDSNIVLIKQNSIITPIINPVSNSVPIVKQRLYKLLKKHEQPISMCMVLLFSVVAYLIIKSDQKDQI